MRVTVKMVRGFSMKYTFSVYKINAFYHGDVKSKVFESCSVDGAYKWIDENPIKENEWAKYKVEVEREEL